MQHVTKLISGILLFLLGQILVWYQINGQFLSEWIKSHPLVMSLMGIPVSLVYIYATQYTTEAFNGDLWPQRLIGFAMGMFAFSFLTWFHLSSDYFEDGSDVGACNSNRCYTNCMEVINQKIAAEWKWKVDVTNVGFTNPLKGEGMATLMWNGQVLNEVYLKTPGMNYIMGHHFLDGVEIDSIDIIINRFGYKSQTNLFYIHIPKTGGTSIEQAAYDYGVRWGRWRYGVYHEPSHVFTKMEWIMEHTLFTTVRNPYSKLVSHFYCPHRIKAEPLPKMETKEEFNTAFYEVLSKYEHPYPQYYFVYDEEGNKVISHVIKLEDGLETQFNKLMKEYNCPIRMSPNYKINTKVDVDGEVKFGVDDLSPENISYINTRYEKDFEYFGYTMK